MSTLSGQQRTKFFNLLRLSVQLVLQGPWLPGETHGCDGGIQQNDIRMN